MAFSAELLLDEAPGERLEAQEVHWGMTQLTDEQNVPMAGLLVGQIRVVLSRLSHPVIANWMADPHKTMAGKVLVQRSDGLGMVRTLTFSAAYCFNQGLRFDGTGNAFATGMSILISAPVLTINGHLVLDNNAQQQ